MTGLDHEVFSSHAAHWSLDCDVPGVRGYGCRPSEPNDGIKKASKGKSSGDDHDDRVGTFQQDPDAQRSRGASESPRHNCLSLVQSRQAPRFQDWLSLAIQCSRYRPMAPGTYAAAGQAP